MQHPFQLLLHGRDTSDLVSDGYLVAACGPKLVSLSLTSNDIITVWTSDDTPQPPNEELSRTEGHDGRPAKKQKISNGTSKNSNAPNVIKLSQTPNNRYIVAVTDDKRIHVFEITEGRLVQLSARCMPKRPCAIEVMSDNTTIVCADKFGDVYSLPLLPATIDDVPAAGAPDQVRVQVSQSEQDFRPAATTLTVHSKRNRDALAAQMKQKNFTPRKEALQFEHNLLLGHVSMLTDMKCPTRKVEGEQRSYIITADRDEHIRISRGPPQAHIIEGFCLGHTQFISKICQVGDLLVSGGGDHWLGIWDWHTFQLCRKVDLIALVNKLDDPPKDYKPAVHGLWSASLRTGKEMEPVLIVALEKVKALFFISLSTLTEDASEPILEATTISLANYPLDVAAVSGSLIVSLDARHSEDERLLHLVLGDKPRGEEEVSTQEELNRTILSCKTLNEFETPAEKGTTDKELDDLLFGAANLRKRAHIDQGDDEEQEGTPQED